GLLTERVRVSLGRLLSLIARFLRGVKLLLGIVQRFLRLREAGEGGFQLGLLLGVLLPVLVRTLAVSVRVQTIHLGLPIVDLGLRGVTISGRIRQPRLGLLKRLVGSLRSC